MKVQTNANACNLVAKHMKATGSVGRTHKDRKRNSKKGYRKHKGRYDY